MNMMRDHDIRRTIHAHIVAAGSKQGIVLASNVIENLINARIKEISETIAVGGSSPMVDWDQIVQRKNQEAMADKRLSEELGVTVMVPGQDK